MPNYQVALRGFNAGGTVGDTEPGFQDLMTTLGYSTSTGINGTYQATTRAPVGDEIIAPYFKRVDTTKPVGLYPIARYVAASTFTSDTGYAPTKYSASRTNLYKFPEDTVDEDPDDGVDSTAFAENQKLMPDDRRGRHQHLEPVGRVRHHRQLRQLHRRPVQQGRHRHDLPEPPGLPGQGPGRRGDPEHVAHRRRHQHHATTRTSTTRTR